MQGYDVGEVRDWAKYANRQADGAPMRNIPKTPQLDRMTAVIGVDIHTVADTEHSLAHFGSAFARRLFSDEEVEFASSHPGGASRFLAERFAAREAILKLLDFSDPFVHWRQVSLRTVTRSKCIVILKGKCEERATDLGLPRIHLTMSSTRHIAMAVAFADYNGTQD